MGLIETAQPVIDMFSGGAAKLASYWWVLFIFVGIAGAIAFVVVAKMIKGKNAQWTHKLITRRVLKNRLLSKPIIIRMRRFPLIKRAEVFELETPLLGGYLMPELDQYSDVNEYSIILDTNNRIYTNLGEYFCPDKNSVNVSAKHSEIDISRADLRADFQNINKTSKRMEWATIAKYAMYSLLIVAFMIVGIVGIGEWGESHAAKAQEAEAVARAMESLADAVSVTDGTANTQLLILSELKDLKGTENIQGWIRSEKNGVI